MSKTQEQVEAARLKYYRNKRAERQALHEKVKLLRAEGFSLREVGDIINMSHEWVRKAEKLHTVDN